MAHRRNVYQPPKKHAIKRFFFLSSISSLPLFLTSGLILFQNLEQKHIILSMHLLRGPTTLSLLMFGLKFGHVQQILYFLYFDFFKKLHKHFKIKAALTVRKCSCFRSFFRSANIHLCIKPLSLIGFLMQKENVTLMQIPTSLKIHLHRHTGYKVTDAVLFMFKIMPQDCITSI